MHADSRHDFKSYQHKLNLCLRLFEANTSHRLHRLTQRKR